MIAENLSLQSRILEKGKRNSILNEIVGIKTLLRCEWYGSPNHTIVLAAFLIEFYLGKFCYFFRVNTLNCGGLGLSRLLNSSFYWFSTAVPVPCI